MKHRFTVTLEKMAAWTVAVIPINAKEVFGMSNCTVRVKGTMNGYPFSGTSLMPMKSGDYLLAVRSSIRKAIRKEAGDTVIIEFERDLAELEIPAELLEAFEASPEAKQMFDSLSYSYKENYTRPITNAKSQSTRERNAVKAVLKLEQLYLEKQHGKSKASSRR